MSAADAVPGPKVPPGEHRLVPNRDRVGPNKTLVSPDGGVRVISDDHGVLAQLTDHYS